MSILPFRIAKTDVVTPRPGAILQGYPIEVMPCTADKKRQARDLSRLWLPFTPDDVPSDLAGGMADGRGRCMAGIPHFSMGGIEASATDARALNKAAHAKGHVA